MGFDIPIDVVVIGLITGLTYALLAVGLVLVYKSSRFINFAHGEMGALAAALLPVLVIRHHWNYWPALVLVLAVAAAAGGLTEYALVRRLARAPRLVVMVASIGAAQIFFTISAFILRGFQLRDAAYPTPFTLSAHIGSLRLGSAQFLILAAAPLITIVLAAFLRRTSLGIASRAAAENLEAAQLAGIPVHWVSLLVWVVAGLLAGVSAILTGPTRPLATGASVVTGAAVGPALMVRALAAATVGGMERLPIVFAGGVGIGVVEALVLWNYPTAGVFEVVLFLLVLASLLLRRGLGQMARGGEGTSWSLIGGARSVSSRAASTAGLSTARRVTLAVAVVAIALSPLPLDNGQRVLFASMAAFALMGLSLVVLTGIAGQVSLGQFAFVGLGALVGGRLHQLGYPLPIGMLYAAVAGGVAALVVGLPALRIRGLFLAVTTLSFAVASPTWLYRQHWLVQTDTPQTSLEIPRTHLFGINFQSELAYCWLVLAVLGAVALGVHRLRSTGVGRSMMAVRDNEAGAAALGISARRMKLLAFVLAGMIAGLAGHLYGGLLVTFREPAMFGPELSLALVAMVILGGVTTITGALVGAIWVRGLAHVVGPHLPSLGPTTVALLVSGPGLVAVLLFVPGGLASVLFAAWDRVVRRVTGGVTSDAMAAPAKATVARHPLPPAVVERAGRDGPALSAQGVSVHFGGNVAVDDVSLELRGGEIVGLVGPNGAGKTTLFDVLSGHLAADRGRVFLDGVDVTSWRADQRARLGLGRTFQQARLFDDLTVTETLEVALEREEPSEIVPSLLGYPPSRRAEQRKQESVEVLVGLLGLGPFASRRVAELSTGTRRLVELGAVIALRTEVLLLDEPTAGIAQREVEAFAPLLREVRDHLDASIIIIEHDIPLVMELADRVYALASGRVIAAGAPADVRNDPAVVAAYLGSDERVIARSGARA